MLINNLTGFTPQRGHDLMSLNKPSPHERRKHDRVTVSIHVYWGWTDDCPFRDRIISLSVGGFFLRTSEGAPYGREIFIKFWLPEEKTLRGEVRYHLERMGVGVEFVGMSEADAEQLSVLVEHYRESQPQ